MCTGLYQVAGSSAGTGSLFVDHSQSMKHHETIWIFWMVKHLRTEGIQEY